MEDTGTAASVSPNWGRASWWAGSAGTLVRAYCHISNLYALFQCNIQYFFVFLYHPYRCCYLLGSGSLWHLPHLWFKGHILYSVAGSTAGKHLHISLFILAHSHASTHVQNCKLPSNLMAYCPSGWLLQRPVSAAGAGSLWT